jgi:hypothetical protein
MRSRNGWVDPWFESRDPAMTAFAIAVLLTLSANVLFPLQDALTKQMITTLPVWAVLFVRSAAVLVVTLAIGRARLNLVRGRAYPDVRTYRRNGRTRTGKVGAWARSRPIVQYYQQKRGRS